MVPAKVMNIVDMENRIKTEPMTAELMLAAKKKALRMLPLQDISAKHGGSA